MQRPAGTAGWAASERIGATGARLEATPPASAHTTREASSTRRAETAQRATVITGRSIGEQCAGWQPVGCHEGWPAPAGTAAPAFREAPACCLRACCLPERYSSFDALTEFHHGLRLWPRGAGAPWWMGSRQCSHVTGCIDRRRSSGQGPMVDAARGVRCCCSSLYGRGCAAFWWHGERTLTEGRTSNAGLLLPGGVEAQPTRKAGGAHAVAELALCSLRVDCSPVLLPWDSW